MKSAEFPFTITWIEELAEFLTENEVTTTTDFLLGVVTLRSVD